MANPSRRFALRVALGIGVTAVGCSKPTPPAPSEEDAHAQKQLQERLIQAAPGETIQLPEGRFRLTRTLTLAGKQDVTLRGAGMDRTILDFSGQRSGAEGLKASGDGLAIEDLAILDTRGDGLKIEKSKRVSVRNVRVEWTRGPHADNGGYGIYPVQCENVLIEGAVARGASDAGLYVGQSRHVVIRQSVAERNVAGIEIENSSFADVHGNRAEGNVGGILVFDLPELEVKRGRHTRVFGNVVRGNNLDNFAPSGNIVAKVPSGTGVMLMATDEVEVFDNEIADHRTVNLAVVSYFITEQETEDASYDPYPERVHVHGNRYGRAGYDPTGGSALQSKKAILGLRLVLGKPFPDLLWDGVVDAAKPAGPRLCIREGPGVRFANLDAANDFAGLSRDLAPHGCSLPPLEPVGEERPVAVD